MKENIFIMAWINKLLMLIFTITLIIIPFNNEVKFIVFCSAFIIGVYQVIIFFLTLLYLNDIDKKRRNLMRYYFIGTVFYFYVLGFCEGGLKEPLMNFFKYLLPILLSFFWTYILETLKKEI